jgi:flagellar basal body P-ring formation protein FlgA
MRWVLGFLLMATPTFAESYIAIRTIPARSVLAATDMTAVDATIAGAVADPASVVGLEARVTVFAGHPILPEDFVAPALVGRNQAVSLIYMRGALQIETEGRALDRAAVGETVRVMNLASRRTVSGVVMATGKVLVAAESERD